MNFRLLTILLITFLHGCGNDNVDPIDSGQDSKLEFENNKDKFDQLRTELSGTDFLLTKAELDSNEVRITVSYAGGCEDHNFDLIWNGADHAVSLDIIELVLVHDGNGDTCEAAITETLTFDFDEITGLNSHLWEHQSISIENASTLESLVIYGGLPSFKASKSCELIVSATEVICGDGAFGNTWFQYVTMSDGSPVYLQPTEIAILGTFVEDLEEGDYLVGVQLSGPYQGEDPICLAYPGPSIPVAIYCLEEI